MVTHGAAASSLPVAVTVACTHSTGRPAVLAVSNWKWPASGSTATMRALGNLWAKKTAAAPMLAEVSMISGVLPLAASRSQRRSKLGPPPQPAEIVGAGLQRLDDGRLVDGAFAEQELALRAA